MVDTTGPKRHTAPLSSLREDYRQEFLRLAAAASSLTVAALVPPRCRNTDPERGARRCLAAKVRVAATLEQAADRSTIGSPRPVPFKFCTAGPCSIVVAE